MGVWGGFRGIRLFIIQATLTARVSWQIAQDHMIGQKRPPMKYTMKAPRNPSLQNEVGDQIRRSTGRS
jgi:hypothetical protein